MTTPHTGSVTPGTATPAGTRAFAERRSAAAYGPLGRTGLTVCRLGFGGYRVNDGTAVHRSALEQALASGVNLDRHLDELHRRGSERLVGKVLGDAIRRGGIAREQIVVVSKIGYVEGQNMALAREREGADRPVPRDGPLPARIAGTACIRRSSRTSWPGPSTAWAFRLSTSVSLHNPEYFLSDAAHNGGVPLDETRGEFYRRLTAAFRFFEERVAAGTLGWYGVSSNTVARPVDDPEATSLAADAGRGRGGRRPRSSFRRRPAAHEPLRGRGRPRLEQPAGRTGGGASLRAGARVDGRDRRPDQPAPQRGRGTRDGAAGRLPILPARAVDRQLEIVREAGGRVPAGDRGAPPSGAGQRQARELPPLDGSARRRPGPHRERDVLGADRVAGPGPHDARDRCPRRRDRGGARPPVERVARPLRAGARSSARRVPRGGGQPEPGAEPGDRRRRRSAAPRSAAGRRSRRRRSGPSPARPASPRCSSGCAGRPTWRTRRPFLGWPPLSPTRARSTRRSGASVPA